VQVIRAAMERPPAATFSNSCLALAVQWELWVLTSVSRDPFHAAYLIRSKKCLYLEPRYGIEP
jgi:hypothetical protein